MVLVVADTELLLDDPGHAGTGPDLTAEAIGLRPVPEEPGIDRFCVGESRGGGPDAGRARSDSGPPSLASASQRLTDTSETSRASAISP